MSWHCVVKVIEYVGNLIKRNYSLRNEKGFHFNPVTCYSESAAMLPRASSDTAGSVGFENVEMQSGCYLFKNKYCVTDLKYSC